MKIFSIFSVACVALAAAAPFAQVNADSAEAMCEVRKDGDTYSLSPGNNAGHYKDQQGNNVVRTSAGNSEEFKWQGGKKIIVTWASTPSTHYPAASNYRAEQPGQLRPLIA